MSGVNKVILVGHVGKDPETKTIDQNVNITKFSLATTDSYKGKDGKKVETTEWHNIVLWRGLADVAAKYVKKGSHLYIEGKIQTRSYDDKDGNKKYFTEIVGSEMVMLGKKSGDGPRNGSTDSYSQEATVIDLPAVTANEAGDDLPF